jgi:hypothetical protein
MKALFIPNVSEDAKGSEYGEAYEVPTGMPDEGD